MALRTVSNTGGNWNATTAWVGGVVPIAGDTVDFTATSGNLTVNVITANLAGIDFTNYTGTITFNNLLNTSGTVNIGTGGFTIAGANFLNINGTATLSGTTQWSGGLRFNGQNITITLLNDITSTGTVRFSSTNSTLANPLVINGFNINIKGNFDVSATANGLTTGTTVLQVNGTSGTSTIAGSANLFFGLSIVINSTNDINMSTHMLFRDATFTYITSNSITWPTTRFAIANTTMNVAATITLLEIGTTTITFTNNLVCYDLFINGTPSFVTNGFLLNVVNDLRLQDVTFSIPNDLYVTNLITTIRPTSSQINGFTIYVSGNLTNGCQGTLFGTTAIVLTGTGIWIHNHPTGAGSLQNNLTINTTGTITISGLIRYNTRTLTYIKGSVKTRFCTLVIGLNTSFVNIHKINFNIITITAGVTLTMNEFFNGTPVSKTRISSIGVTNYTVTFTDTKKKISKYIRISNATINTRGQLRVVGDNSCNRGNNVGIQFEPNQTPNGVALNNGITANLTDGITFGASGLLNDPVYN